MSDSPLTQLREEITQPKNFIERVMKKYPCPVVVVVCIFCVTCPAGLWSRKLGVLVRS